MAKAAAANFAMLVLVSGVFERIGRVSTPVLYGLSYSPWTMQVRWALAHHGIEYLYREYVPMLGEPWLRAVGGRGATQSVPLLIAKDLTVGDSWAIARWADRVGSGASLFPQHAMSDMEELHTIIEAGKAAGRALAVAAMARDPQAQRESLPGFVPEFMRGVLRPAAGMAVGYVARKYGTSEAADAEHESTLERALSAIRRAKGDRTTIFAPHVEHVDGLDSQSDEAKAANGSSSRGPLAGLSYADMFSCATLEFVQPHPGSTLGAAARRCWTRPGLAREFRDLLEWRETLLTQLSPRWN